MRLSIALILGWVLGAILGWGGPTGASWASDVSLVGLALVAAISLGRAAGRRARGARLPFVLLSAGCALWALGEGTWAAYELVLGREVPFPSPADISYLAAPLVVGCGLLALSKGMRRRSHRARAALDGFLVAGSCLAIGWVVLLAPVAAHADGGPLAVIVAVAYPVSDIVLVTVALLAARASVAGRSRRLDIVAFGALAMAVSDSAFTVLELHNRYASGGLVDVGWVVAYLAFAHAGADSGVKAEHPERVDADEVLGRMSVLLPYLLVVGAVATLGTAAFVSDRSGPVGIALLGVLVAVLVVRQALTVLDNVALTSLLSLRERHFRSLVHGAKDVIVLCGRDLRTTYVSPASSVVLGVEPEDMVGKSFWDLVHPDDLAAVQEAVADVLERGAHDEGPLLRCRIASDQGWVDTESTVGDLRSDPGVAGIVITARDVSDRTTLEAQLKELAWRDSLTGLANRVLLLELLGQALEQRRGPHQPVGLLLIDLDGFKPVNDTHGHAAGDALLVQVAERLNAGVRSGDTVARLGGDEFAVLLDARGTIGLARGGVDVAERLLASLHEKFILGGHEVTIGASIGLALAVGATDADVLLRQADFAMYASKNNGRGRLTVFGPELAVESSRRTAVAEDLADALAREELTLAYQPVVDLATGRAIGAEALARWEHAQWGRVPPSEFVAAAERTGLIVRLGHWALVAAAGQAAAWQAQGRQLGVAVNVSVRQLGADFVDAVAAVLEQHRLAPGRLTLEITESLLVDDERTLSSLRALRDLGVRLALDDFGTGWSSLSYLRRLPVDALKLDGSFVAGLGSSQANAVSRTVINLGNDLGLQVVAEGVETEQQRELLLEMGCRTAQGYLFGEAGPAEAVERLAAVPPVVPEQTRREALVILRRTRM